MTKDIMHVAFFTLARDEQLREELTVILYDLFLFNFHTAWFLSEKVNSNCLDCFVECGHFVFQSISEFHETCSTSVCHGV